MIELHLYGNLRKLASERFSCSEDTVLNLKHVKDESFEGLVKRLNLKPTDLGDCFIDGTLAKKDTIIKDEARVALFPFNMVLLCGGQHLKGHGYTRKDLDIDYY